MSKRTAVAKQLIQQFYFQLTEGCGRSNCTNPNCASNPNNKKLSSDAAAAKAMILFKEKKSLCDKPPSKVPRTDIESQQTTCEVSLNEIDCNGDKSSVEGPEKNNTSSDFQNHDNHPNDSDITNCDQVAPSSSSSNLNKKSDTPKEALKTFSENSRLTKESMADDGISKKLENIFVTKPPVYSGPTIDAVIHLFESSMEENDLLTAVKDLLWKLFSSTTSLNMCSLLKEDLKSQQNTDEDKDIDEMDEQIVSEKKPSMDDLDGDVDDSHQFSLPKLSSQTSSQSPLKQNIHPTVSMDNIKSLYKYLFNYPSLTTVMLNAIAYLTNEVERQLISNKNAYLTDPNYLNMFVIIMDSPLVQGPDALSTVFPKFCKVLSRIPIPAQAALARYWSKCEERCLRDMIENLQQLITVKIVSEVDDSEDSLTDIHTNEGIVAAAKCLNIFYYASILGGTLDKKSWVTPKKSEQKKERDLFSLIDKETDHFSWVDPLGSELNLTGMDSLKPLVPLSEFINEPLNDTIKIEKDYTNFKINQQGTSRFSFLHCPFMLNISNKITHLFYDNRITMYSERRRTFVTSIVQGEIITPYLRLNIRRNHVIEDTLLQLEYTSEKDFKKQLFVEFDKEEGVDEGGVSKEFFQLIIDELFNPENGVFIYDDDTRLYWFNLHSFESKTQYKLIGIVFGLAIYNNCILDVNFPSFVYKKLLGKNAIFPDMEKFQPVLYKSLQYLLDYEGNVEEDLMLTFRIEYNDVFGAVQHHDLKDGGENLPVTNHNRQEYVQLYVDWLLNASIADQFNAFMSGFELVVSDSPLKHLFDDQELELLIRGSEDYDFDELKRTTKYDGGFTRQSPTIVHFWSVVHELSEQEKRSLLQFSTGSDRAPIIARNGPDSDRLPTAHTCFNVILLPDYRNREKLKERLLKAIKYSKGFGML